MRRVRYSHRIYYFTDYQLVVVVHDASTSQVAKCFLAGRPLMPKSLLQRFKFRKNPEPKQQIFDLFSFIKITNSKSPCCNFSLQQIDKKTRSHHKKYFHLIFRCEALILLVFLGQFLKSYL